MATAIELARDVKNKRELESLDIDFVLSKVEAYLKNNPKIAKKLAAHDYRQFMRSQERAHALKSLRSELRSIYGVFISPKYVDRQILLKSYISGESKIEELLALHKSSKERLGYHEEIYRKIFAITGIPHAIADLGCGLNPLSYGFLGCEPFYFASDISEQDMAFIREFFALKGIEGEAARMDLLSDDVSRVRADIVFLFKALDSLEAIKRHSSKRLLEKLDSRWIIVSFSTRSIGGKKEISISKRSWFEKFVKSKGWSSHTFEMPGEAFVIVDKG